MTLKEELTAKKEALAELKDRIEAGEAEAIEAGVKLQGEIETKQAEIETAEKKASLLNVIGKKEGEPMEENTIKSMDWSQLKKNAGSLSVQLKAATDDETTTQIQSYSQNVAGITAQLRVRDLFSQETISGNALTYYRLGTIEYDGFPGVVAEGAKKTRFHIPYDPITVPLVKIGGYMKDTDELLSDAPFLESAIRSRGILEFNRGLETYLMSVLTAYPGVQKVDSAISFDSILEAKQNIFADTGYAPDALVINPADMTTLLQSKDGNQQYLLGGPAYGSYGNGAYSSNPRIWGLEVVESSAVEAGYCVVGAFKAGASVVTKAGEGLRVEVSNSNEDDFIYNRITVRIEERLVEAVRIPAAFAVVGTNS